MATIIDTLRAADQTRFNGQVRFVPIDAPAFNASIEVYDSKPLSVQVVDGDINQNLEPGNYRFFLANSRPLLIRVPADAGIYTISDITVSEVPDVGTYVPGDALVSARDMRFSVTEVSENDRLIVPAKRQLLTFGQIQVLDTSEIIVNENGEMAVIYEVP